MNYMSSIRRQLEDVQKCAFFNENFVTKLRTKMRKKYLANAIEKGKNVTNKAPSMTMDDKKFMSRAVHRDWSHTWHQQRTNAVHPGLESYVTPAKDRPVSDS